MNSFINITNELIYVFISSIPQVLADDSIKGVVAVGAAGFLCGLIMAFVRYK